MLPGNPLLEEERDRRRRSPPRRAARRLARVDEGSLGPEVVSVQLRVGRLEEAVASCVVGHAASRSSGPSQAQRARTRDAERARRARRKRSLSTNCSTVSRRRHAGRKPLATSRGSPATASVQSSLHGDEHGAARGRPRRYSASAALSDVSPSVRSAGRYHRERGDDVASSRRRRSSEPDEPERPEHSQWPDIRAQDQRRDATGSTGRGHRGVISPRCAPAPRAGPRRIGRSASSDGSRSRCRRPGRRRNGRGASGRPRRSPVP